MTVPRKQPEERVWLKQMYIWRQLSDKVDPRTKRIKIFLMVVDP